MLQLKMPTASLHRRSPKKKLVDEDDDTLTELDMTSSGESFSTVCDESESTYLAWMMWEGRFKTSSEDLLIDSVDLDTQRHMSLKPLLPARARREQEQILLRESPMSPDYWLQMERQQRKQRKQEQKDTTRMSDSGHSHTGRRKLGSKVMRKLIRKVARQ